jgi:hypothetical protein
LVDAAAYAALLGYPDQGLPDGRILELATASRQWFREHARPWGRARVLAVRALDRERIELDNGVALNSSALAARLRQGGSTELIVAMVSAGAEVDLRSATLWRHDRPDEAYFVDRLGAAAARRLAGWVGDHLRAEASRGDLDVLPGYSPGFDGWSLDDQKPLADCLGNDEPGRFRVLDSGMIDPKNTLLAAFGVTELRAVAEDAWRRHPCSWCSLADCRVRTAGYR